MIFKRKTIRKGMLYLTLSTMVVLLSLYGIAKEGLLSVGTFVLPFAAFLCYVHFITLKYMLENKEKEYRRKCGCGKELKITTNVYDNSNSGMTHCECGAKWIIN